MIIKERHITIKEVARKAGVGIATVSRVLNNSAHVDPETRTRVNAVIRRFGYRPNAQGRRLVKRATEMVCFVLSNRDFMNPFHSGILYGVERFLSQAGHDVVFTNLHYLADTPAGELALPRILTHRGIADGVILAGTNYPNLLAAMDQMRVPYVLFGNNIVGRDLPDGVPAPPDSVYYEERSSARALVEMLVDMGHRAVWFVGDTRMPWFRRRNDAYREVLAARGLQPREYIAPCEGDYHDYGLAYGEQAAEHILRSLEPVTAMFAGNDGIAYGLWKSLTRKGVRVPNDVSLVGFDDVQEARLVEPPLTTVHVPTAEIGRACAQLLMAKLAARGKPQPGVIVPTSVVLRGSCAPRASAAAQPAVARV